MKRGLRICLSFDRRRRQKLKKWSSETSDEQKIGKNGFPRPRMSGKREKMCFQPLGRAKKCRKTLVVGWRNAKNAKKCLSSVDETQKLRENARCRSTKREKRWKMLVVGRRNAKNAEKCSSSADETQKTWESARRRPTKCRKRRKTVFRTPTTSKKRWKPRFVGVQSIKNGKNSLS